MYSDEENQDDLELTEDNQNGLEEAQENAPIASDEQQENAGNETNETKTAKTKRNIRNPQPKLDAEALKAPKGLSSLPKCFKNIKYSGPGHEKEDLKKVMKSYEYWCHRMYPKFTFDDCVAKLEKLGTKKPVQTYIKKIRMDLVEDDIITNNDDYDVGLETASTEEIVTQRNEPELNEEQLERIRLNRERAIRLRLERSQRNLNKSTLTNTECDIDESHDGSLQASQELSNE